MFAKESVRRAEQRPILGATAVFSTEAATVVCASEMFPRPKDAPGDTWLALFTVRRPLGDGEARAPYAVE